VNQLVQGSNGDVPGGVSPGSGTTSSASDLLLVGLLAIGAVVAVGAMNRGSGAKRKK
jgi:hypothetical protein